MSVGLCPVTDEERPHLVALGQQLRALRDETGMTQRQVAALATLSPGYISSLELGRWRTRRSTLGRLVAVLVAEHRREAILAELVETAGPALAPESDWAERVERRRLRREQRDLPTAIEELKGALGSARRLARLWPEGHPKHAFGVEHVAALEQHLADMEANAATLRTETARARSGPPSDPRRPAWSAYQTFVHQLTGGRMRGTLSLTAEQRERLGELRAAKDAEASDLDARSA